VCDKLAARIWKSQHREHVKEYCRSWRAEHPGWQTKRNHDLGKNRPYSEAKDCSQYLGVHIAERVLSGYFDKITKMPTNNHGFDFVCGKGYKIDAKSACITRCCTSYGWSFSTRGNKIPDYFLCLAFDSRESLTPLHVWLIPVVVLENRVGLWITNSAKGLKRYQKYEKPLDKIISCCNRIKCGVNT